MKTVKHSTIKGRSLRSQILNFENGLEGEQLSIAPGFQRGFRTENNNFFKKKLFNTLISNSFLPSIVISSNDDGTNYLVDGQQRVRTP